MKNSRLAALVLALGSVNAWADLNATAYEGWALDDGGNISTVGLPVLGSFVDPNIDHWDGDLSYRWSPFGRDELYTVAWDGFLIAPSAGSYQFRSTSDDGVQVFIDSAAVISSTSLQHYGVSTGSATLSAGTHAFNVRFYENFVFDGIRLEWQTPGSTTWEVIPATALVTEVPEPAGAAMLLAGLSLAVLGRGRLGRPKTGATAQA